jgi:transposase
MGQAIGITNLDYSATDLRRLMSKEKDGAVVRRLLALALILEGKTRTEAAQQSGMERQTLRDWVHRYNAEGVAGLASRVGPGPTPLLTDAQMAEFKKLVVKGPDPKIDKVVRWRWKRSRRAFRSRCISGRWPSGCACWS